MEPSENLPKESHPNITDFPTQTADPLGMLGWVLASVSVLVGFVVIAVATRIDGEAADHRKANLSRQEADSFRSPSDPIPRHSPGASIRDVIQTQSHNTASSPQQRTLGEEKDTLDGKEVRKALPVGVRRIVPIKP
jgi:hypothetical protein